MQRTSADWACNGDAIVAPQRVRAARTGMGRCCRKRGEWDPSGLGLQFGSV